MLRAFFEDMVNLPTAPVEEEMGVAGVRIDNTFYTRLAYSQLSQPRHMFVHHNPRSSGAGKFHQVGSCTIILFM